MHARTTPRRCERGQVTAEYAVGATVGVTAIAGILIGPEPVVSDWIGEFLVEHVTRAFSLTLPELFRWPW
ncbi:hypothetical protein AFL01nite_11590 [Aeromicrobium flavum]|uniref:DUF4244 domain-containing protein n=1 Tax=Aeromicrobium flavum TaxID=416568 RepID=A0A512HTP6_9ACTN|nr:DUF4244 domain-containing protein [Aeromicrobium flavum]GEO88832.1 hypothetical protein AFL01nite_11590 [Aeromicrobium flavum]